MVEVLKKLFLPTEFIAHFAANEKSHYVNRLQCILAVNKESVWTWVYEKSQKRWC